MQTNALNRQPGSARLFRYVSIALCSAAMLTACGGGGGDANPVVQPSSTDFPLASIMSSFVQAPHQYELTATVGGKVYALTDAYAPLANATFEGKASLAALQTVTIKTGGAVSSVIRSNLYFAANPNYVQLGSTDPDSADYTVVVQTANLPISAKLGQAGPIGTATNYLNSNKTTVVDTAAITWTLEADTGGAALFCIVTDIGGTDPIKGSECLRIDTTGRVLGRVIKATSGGVTITFS